MIELYSTDDPVEAGLIKQTLNNNGIDAEIFDENIVQVAPYLSQVVGGIKVMVNEEDLQHAKIIVEKELEIKIEQGKGYEEFILNYTKDIPFLNKQPPIIQLLIAVATIFISIGGIVIFSYIPSNKEKLISKNWCVSQMLHKGTEIQPYTQEYETLDYQKKQYPIFIFFDKDSKTVTLPGVDSPKIIGSWKFTAKDSIKIQIKDTLPDFYNDVFYFEFSLYGELTLKSKDLLISCYSSN